MPTHKTFNQIGRLSLLMILSFAWTGAWAQQGVGTNTPSKATVMEMKSASKGLLIPRVQLTNLNVFAPVSGELPNDADKVNSILVYNTNTSAAQNLLPGYYYWTAVDQKWNRLINASDLESLGGGDEIWYDQNNIGNPATLNTHDIYQDGRVAVNKNSDFNANVALDVSGSVRGGDPDLTAAIGSNSSAFGDNVKATQENAAAFGFYSEATGRNAFAIGGNNYLNWVGPGGLASGDASFASGVGSEASGKSSFAGGGFSKNPGQASHLWEQGGKAVGDISFAFGLKNQALGDYSTSFGHYTQANTRSEFVIGRANAIFQPQQGNSNEFWIANDPLFQVGNGDDTEDNSQRSNALTVMKNGKVGIGISGQNNDAKPTEMLDIGSGNVRVRDLHGANATDANAKFVVVESDGVLKSLNDANMVAMPSFFYMPPMAIPTHQDQIPAPNQAPMFASYNGGTQTFTVNLHAIYTEQFGSPMQSSPGSTGLPGALANNQLEYYVTYYDPAVFTNVNVSATGQLTYKIQASAEVSVVSFMNVVFKVK